MDAVGEPIRESCHRAERVAAVSWNKGAERDPVTEADDHTWGSRCRGMALRKCSRTNGEYNVFC